jgi:hypothetical protein
MKYVKEQTILAAINDGGSATFASVTATVEHKVAKTNNPLRQSTITKRVKYRVILNANYANVVNNQRVREGKEADFVPKANWHEKVYDSVNGSIVRNRKDHDSTYLSAIVQSADVQQFFVDGREATESEIATIKSFTPQKSAANQGVEKEVIFRTIKIGNIESITVNKMTLTF